MSSRAFLAGAGIVLQFSAAVAIGQTRVSKQDLPPPIRLIEGSKATAIGTQDTAVVQTEAGSVLLVRIQGGADAVALQVHFQDFNLPEGVRLFIYGENGSAGPYRGAGPTNQGEFISDPVAGNEIVLEMETGDLPMANLPFRIAVTQLNGDELALYRQPLTPPSEHPMDGQRGTANFRGVPVAYEIKNGLAIFEGDIILGEPFELEPAAEKILDRQAVAITGSSYRWPGGVVPYVVDPTLPSQVRITDAVNHWNTNLAGVIRLVPRTNEAYYLRFVRPSSAGTCSSYIGYIRRANQAVNIGDYCSTGNVIHEIGHAVGAFHEQSREDRNSYVRILTQNIQAGTENNFAQNIAASDDIGLYDYSSIMHYSAYAFSKNGQPTIETIPPGIPIGQRTALSARDIAGVRTIYGAAPPPPPPPPPTTVSATFTTNPVGKKVKVDNVDVNHGTVLAWALNSTHTVSAPDILEGQTRYKYSRWSNNGAQTQSIIATAALTLTAYFTPQYVVTAVSSNPTRGSVTITGASDGGFYNSNSTVTVAAQPAVGSCLSSWSGVPAVTGNSFLLTVNQPYQITANFGAVVSALTPNHVWMPKTGGTVTVPVPSSGCPWTATTLGTWFTLGSASGTSSGGAFTVTASPNTGAFRSAPVTVGTAIFYVLQN